MSSNDICAYAPAYVIYCDESCHELTPKHRFMSIGGLKVPQNKKQEVTKDLKAMKKSCGLNAELKWSKVSDKKLEAYKKVVDFFFGLSEIQFRAIVVDQTKLNFEEFHGKDRELAFYKFYYEMLGKWIEAGNQYLILLDYKKNRGADRYTTLKTYLERHFRGKAWIIDLTVIDSKETPLAQLCDVFTGAVAAANNGPTKGTAKERLIAHINAHLRPMDLSAPTAVTEAKFNIFKINLR